jgi:ubiquinone/menaquinone biosynthesis C-methylase UbiE
MTVDAQRKLREATARRSGRGWYRWDDPAYQFLMQSLERRMAALLSTLPAAALGGPVLEIGCGTGHWLRAFARWGAGGGTVTGLDLLPERLRESRTLGPATGSLVCGSASDLPFATGSFNLALQSMVFSSIPDRLMRDAAAREVLRVLSPEGCLIWYDFFVRRPGNRDVCPMPRREVARLFPSCRVQLDRVTLAPPITRALARHSKAACEMMERMPFLRTHYLGIIRRA